MSPKFDVIVVGGGVTGLCTALHLKQYGVKRVAVLEQHHIGAGQSGRAAGIVRALVPHAEVSGWQFQSQQYFKSFTEKFGQPIDVNECGYLLLTSRRDQQRVDQAIEIANRHGARARCVDAAEAAELQPGIRVDAETFHAFEPGAIHLDPMPITFAIASAARQAGVEVFEGCEVGDLLVKRGLVTGVESSDGRFEAPRLMVATAAWGTRQLARVGVEVPVSPHRAEMAFFHVPLSGGHTLRRIVSDGTSQLYLRPEGVHQMFVGWREGDFICGPNNLVPEDPDNYKQTATYGRLAEMHQRLARTLTFMHTGFSHRTYACVYDYSPDGQPVLDRAEDVAGLYFALGFSGGGFSISPCVGKAMAEFIATGARPASIEWLRLSRFAEGRMIQWSNSSAEIPV